MFISLAVRNIVRNARRSLLTVTGIAVGLAALLFLWGFNDGVHNSMTRNLQETIVGSIQIHAQGFFRQPRLERVIPDTQAATHVVQAVAGNRYSLRLQAFALAAGGDNSEGLVMLGIDPGMEHRISRLHEKVGQGRFLRPGDTHACVLGAATARNLGLHVGDELALLAEDRYRALAAERFQLVGIIESGEMGIDRGLAIVPLAFMQRMLAMQGRVSHIVLQVPREHLEATTADLRDRLNRARYEVLRWYDMYPMMRQWVDLENGFYYIFLTIVLAIVASGIMNTMLMSMFDRIHEFGVMMALGCGRWRLACVVVAESVLLGLAGMLAGTAAGLGLVAFFHTHGINLASQMDTISRFYIDPVIRTEIDTAHLLHTVLAVLAAAVIAAALPAWRAARLEPVQAIRHV